MKYLQLFEEFTEKTSGKELASEITNNIDQVILLKRSGDPRKGGISWLFLYHNITLQMNYILVGHDITYILKQGDTIILKYSQITITGGKFPGRKDEFDILYNLAYKLSVKQVSEEAFPEFDMY